jgi:RsiW-degrading membrane proteinase PrsW (M82 family)
MLLYEYEVLPRLAVYLVSILIVVSFAVGLYRYGRRRRPDASGTQLALVALILAFLFGGLLAGMTLMPLDWILGRLL